MIVLGVTDGITCGAALVRDGEIIAAVNEERLSRLKMAYGFPRESISEVIVLAGIEISDIDYVLVATTDNYFFNGVRAFDGWLQDDKGFMRNAVFSVASRLSYLLDSVSILENLYYRSRWPIFARRRKTIVNILEAEFGLGAPVEFVDHHLAHAASAYFTSGFDDATVVTMDGGGDGASSHTYVAKNGRFQRLDYTSAYNSLGNYYAYVTHLCGFKAQKHEGKITGLAAHGKPIFLAVLDSMISFREGKLKNVGRRVFGAAVEELGRRLPKEWRREDLAASIQEHSEQLATQQVQTQLKKGLPQDLAIAGGLFANVRINQTLHELPGVKRIFVHPGMTDGGLAVGAALTRCISNATGSRMVWKKKVVRDVYLGREYSSEQIERDLQLSGLSYERSVCIERDVARLLAAGYVVARFNGRMEYGPRALGNRSILYQPNDPSVNDWLNKKLCRTEFMPFAPSTLMEHSTKCFNGLDGATDAARFMTITFDCTDFMKKNCSGVVHIDGTARPQLVRAEDNPSYHRILTEFHKLTKLPTIINTSFNMHEEPIVCSPSDAIRAFVQGNLEMLAIGEFLVKTRGDLNRRLLSVSDNRV